MSRNEILTIPQQKKAILGIRMALECEKVMGLAE